MSQSRTTVDEAIGQYITDPALKEILCAPTIYVGGFPETMGYLYYLHILFANLHQGTAYVVGSSQRLSNMLVDSIRAGGGEVILGRPVRRVLTDSQSNAIGVEIMDGRHYESTQIIINASPHFALERLFDPIPSLEPVRARLRALQPSFATTTLYLVLDYAPAELGFMAPETMVFSDDHGGCVRLRQEACQAPAEESIQERAYWRSSPMEVTNYHALDPGRNRVLVANVLDRAAHWPDRNDRSQYAAYKAKKRRAADTIVARLAETSPRLPAHIEYRELASPRTYERFTNNTAGAGYGAVVGTDVSGHSFHYDFPIKGVSFMSAWTAGPGYEAAIGYAEARVNAMRS